MPEDHLAEYELFAAREPIGMGRSDFQTGLTIAHLVSALVGGKHAPRDYMPLQYRDDDAVGVEGEDLSMPGDIII